MNKQQVIEDLSLFGLDSVEVQIYLNLLETGSKTPLDLSRETGINRSKIYRYLDRLKRKRLIEGSNIGRGLRLKAASPDNLKLLVHEKEHLIRSQKEKLPELLKELTVLPSVLKKSFEIKHFHGLEGLKQMLWNQLSAKKEILLFGYQTKNEIVGRAFAEKVREEQVKRRITLYEIENYVDPGDFKFTDVPNWYQYYSPRFVPEKIIEIKHYTGVYNNTVFIMNWLEKEALGVEIVNSDYASMQRQLFWSVWEKIATKAKQPKLDI
ncbi:TrmB family transcriptional regulator [Patescibacteria group bacterium]